MSPSAMSSSKPKRESMLSRSARIIGKELPDAKQEDGQSTEPALNQDSSSKRRGQVLKAQRAHRRRTQNYILELEKEVLRLRKREAEMTAELDLQHSSLKSGFDTSQLSNTSNRSGTASGRQSRESSMVNVNLSEYAHVEAGYPCSKVALGIEPEIPTFTADDLAKLAKSATGDTPDDDSFTPNAQSAIDFILDLERPCLSHIKYDLTTKLPTPFEETYFNYGRSHSCTATAKVIQSCPNVDWTSQEMKLPQQVVENLLANSRSLPLGPEMTPVQVWELLTNIAANHNVSMTKVALVKGELSKYMRCNAFGSSIPIDALRHILHFCFPSYDATHLHDIHVPAAEPELTLMNENMGTDWNEFF